MAYKSQQELYDAFIVELQNQRGDLTDTQIGSIIDLLAGVISTAVDEVTKVTQDEFRKTFFDTANGPEITGAADELQTLAVDHFGSAFARPPAVKATGTVTFSRANNGAGNCDILAGTIVKTLSNAQGTSVRFETVATVTMTGTSINASVRAIIAGPTGNVQANKVVQIETTLTDGTITVNNAAVFSGGSDAENDAEYRETIRLLVKKIRGGTKEAIEAAAIAVAGIAEATAIEVETPVIDYDIGAGTILAGAEFYRIPFVELFVCDANGTASLALINLVYDAIKDVRSYGIFVKVSSASASILDWTASIVLNVSGPNYAELSADPQKIIDSMNQYISELSIGDDFIRANANAAILAIWGAAGTNDLTGFTTSAPSGDVSSAANEKLIAGTVEIV